MKNCKTAGIIPSPKSRFQCQAKNASPKASIVPSAIMTWYTDTIAPRTYDGDDSAKKIDDDSIEVPIPKPLKILPKSRNFTELEYHKIPGPRISSKSDIKTVPFLPILSVKTPPKIDPIAALRIVKLMNNYLTVAVISGNCFSIKNKALAAIHVL